MPSSYTTKKGFKKHSYEIKEDGVSIFISTPISKEEHKVPFDVIPEASSIYSERSKIAFWCMIGFSVLSILCLVILLGGGDAEEFAWLFWGFFATTSAVYYFFSKKTYIIYSALNEVVLYFKIDNRSEDDVEEFISQINISKMKYLEIKVGQYLRTLAREQVNGYIVDLRERMILDDKGFESLVQKVEKYGQTNIVGFKKV